MESHIGSPCAGCKFLRRKCKPNCIFAPYFPPDQIQKFQTMHKVFGASNLAKMLQEMQPDTREDAVNSLSYEAEMRHLDPVYGCIGIISALNHQLNQLRTDLNMTKAELVKCQTLGLPNQSLISTATTPNIGTFNHQLNQLRTGLNMTKADLVKYQNLGLTDQSLPSTVTTANVGTFNRHHHHQLYSSLQQQQSNMGMNFIGTCTSNIGQDQFYNQNHNFFGEDMHKQTILSFHGANNIYSAENVGMSGIIGGQVNKFQYPINADPVSIISPNISHSLQSIKLYDMTSHI